MKSAKLLMAISLPALFSTMAFAVKPADVIGNWEESSVQGSVCMPGMAAGVTFNKNGTWVGHVVEGNWRIRSGRFERPGAGKSWIKGDFKDGKLYYPYDPAKKEYCILERSTSEN